MIERISKRIGMKVAITVVVILTTIGVYSLIGVLVNITNMRIYDEFPDDFILREINSEQELKCRINNNSPWTLPFINPFYTVAITIVDSENNASAYFIGSGDKKRNFTDYSFDAGRIDSGNSKRVHFFFYPQEGNATFRVEVYLSFGIHILATSKTYSVEHNGNGNYTISKTE